MQKYTSQYDWNNVEAMLTSLLWPLCLTLTFYQFQGQIQICVNASPL